MADRGYDHDKHREGLRQRGTQPLISRRGTRDNNQSVRWVVEQTLALLHQFRRLAERWERRTDMHRGFLTLACDLRLDHMEPLAADHDPARDAVTATQLVSVGP